MKTINAIQAVFLIILGTIIVSDINARFITENEDSGNRNNLQELDAYARRQLSSQQIEVLGALYEKFSEPSDETTNAITNLSGNLEDDPTKLLLNEHLLELKAIVSVATNDVNHRDNYVLIKDTDLESKVTEIVRVANKHIIHGFEINLIDNRHIRLIPKNLNAASSLDNKAPKEFILAMYRRTESSQSGNKE